MKSVSGNRAYDNVLVKFTRGTSDVAEMKANIFRPKVTADKTVLLDLPLSNLSDTMDAETDTPGLLREEVEWAVHNMNTRKSPGMDHITAEEIRVARGFGVDVFFRLLTRVGFGANTERMVTLNHCSDIQEEG